MLTVFVSLCAAASLTSSVFCLEYHGMFSGVSEFFHGMYSYFSSSSLCDCYAMPQGRHSQPSNNWIDNFYGSFKVLLIDS